MSEGERADVAPSSELAALVLDRFGVAIHEAPFGVRGEESIGWPGTSSDGDRFVQLFPTWRAPEELGWCDAVARAAASACSAAVHGIASRTGEIVVPSAEGPVMAFPFVDGTHPDGPHVANAAAALLADLHRGIAASWDRALGRRPRPGRGAPGVGADLMVDVDLDAWEREVANRSVELPIHGDFYAGNLLGTDDVIAGVIDWSDADLTPLEQEVAWAAWEFCQVPAGDELDDGAAAAFLATYRAAGGPATVDPPFDPFPWIRTRLRREAREWFADPRSTTETNEYHEAQVVAFDRLGRRRFGGGSA